MHHTRNHIAALMRVQVILARKVREKLAPSVSRNAMASTSGISSLRKPRSRGPSTRLSRSRTECHWDQRRYRGRWETSQALPWAGGHVACLRWAGEREEFQCAQPIDSLPGLKFWIRNVARHPNSFWLPTATDKFYPDFVAQLEDGRLLVVEYKGAHIADGPDTAEKRTIASCGEEERWQGLIRRGREER